MKSPDINKMLFDLSDDISKDYQYLGVYLFISYKNHCKFNYLSEDVVKFIENAFNSNDIHFANLLTRYEYFKYLSELSDM